MRQNLSDEDVDEIVDKIESKEDERQSNLTSRLEPRQKLMMGAGGLILLLLYRGGQVTGQTAVLVFIGIVIVTYFSVSGDFAGGRPLKLSEHKVLASKIVSEFQRDGSVSKGNIVVHGTGRMQHLRGKPWFRNMKVSVFDPNGIEHVFSLGLDAFSGDLTEWVERKEGFRGDEKPHIAYVFGEEAQMEKKRSEFMKGSRRRY
jgi:hypothetical protein